VSAGRVDVARAVAWRSVHNFLTNPAFLVPALMFPLFFFTSFAGGLSAIGNVPGFDFPTGYTAFQFVFVLLQSAAFGGVFTGFAMARATCSPPATAAASSSATRSRPSSAPSSPGRS
jgi:hypothetical protein